RTKRLRVLRRHWTATRWRCLLNLHFGVVLERSEDLEAPGHDLVAWLEALDDFDVGRAHDPAFDRNKSGSSVPYDEDALHLFLGLLKFFGGGRGGARLLLGCESFAVGLLIALFKLASGADGQGLDRDVDHVLASCRGDFGRGRKSRTQAEGRIVEGDHHFEVLGLLGRARGGRGGRLARGAADSGLTDFRHATLKSFVREGVNGYLGGLAQLDVYDVGLIHLHFRRYHRQFRYLKQHASRRVLDAWNDVLPHVHGQRGDDAIDWRGVDGLILHVPESHELGPRLHDARFGHIAVVNGLLVLRLGLSHAGLRGLEVGAGHVVIAQALVKHLLRDQLVLE